MLLSSGQPLPTDIFVHDYLTAGGRKISKSGAGAAALEPAALAAEYGADAVRWWLLREVPRVGDADFTVERLIARADDELANGLGNLVNRVVAMIHRYRDGRVPDVAGSPSGPPGGEALEAACRRASGTLGAALGKFDFRQATAAVWIIVDEANGFVNRIRPLAVQPVLSRSLWTKFAICANRKYGDSHGRHTRSSAEPDRSVRAEPP